MTMEIKTMGNVESLKGMFMEELRAGKTRCLKDIPVELLTIDTTYQTPVRTDRNMNYLVNNWSERKLLPLIVVPHFETGLCYVVDGWGRLNASQIVDRNAGTHKYEYMSCLVLLDAPEDITERRKFEAEEYANQNRNVATMKPLHKHGALEILGDDAVKKLNQMKQKYGFEFSNTRGFQKANFVGNYTYVLDLCNPRMGDVAEYVFDIINLIGFNRLHSGYSKYVMNALRDAWKYFPENRKATKQFLKNKLRGLTPQIFKANAVTKYPMLNDVAACSLYVEDLIVEHFGYDHIRMESDGKVITVNTAA